MHMIHNMINMMANIAEIIVQFEPPVSSVDDEDSDAVSVGGVVGIAVGSGVIGDTDGAEIGDIVGIAVG